MLFFLDWLLEWNSFIHVCLKMSSTFANRRKPRKIGGDDEEDDSGGQGMSFTVPIGSVQFRESRIMEQKLTV